MVNEALLDASAPPSPARTASACSACVARLTCKARLATTTVTGATPESTAALSPCQAKRLARLTVLAASASTQAVN